MDENTRYLVASNLTAAYYSVNNLSSSKELDSQTKELFVSHKTIISTFKGFLTELKHSEKELTQLVEKLRG